MRRSLVDRLAMSGGCVDYGGRKPSETQAEAGLIYIVGCGRSGSTLLDIVLGQADGVASCGEVSELLRRGWSGANYCSCGTRIGECAFWGQVRERWFGGVSAGEERKVLRRLRRVERYRSLLRAPASDLAFYASQIRQLYDAIRAVSGATWLVDSSKNPVRLLRLTRALRCEVRVIHLVRHPLGVVASLSKGFAENPSQGVEREIRPIGPLRSAFSWLIANSTASLVCRKVKATSSVVRFEDFVKHPARVLGTLEALRELPAPSRSQVLGRLSIGHLAGGNRLRMAEAVRLDPSRLQEPRMSRPASWAVRLVAQARAKQLGYRF